MSVFIFDNKFSEPVACRIRVVKIQKKTELDLVNVSRDVISVFSWGGAKKKWSNLIYTKLTISLLFEKTC